MKAVNKNNNFILAENLSVASTFFGRTKGLLGRASLPAGEGLLIEKCASIHMFFMRFPIDAVFIDKTGRVVHILRDFKPWRISKIVPYASAVLELPAGTVGDKVHKDDMIIFK